MQELKERKIRVVQGPGRNPPAASTSRNNPVFFRLFSFPALSTGSRAGAGTPKSQGVKAFPSRIPKNDLAAMRSWVALEERIVHDYQEQKPQLRSVAASFQKKITPPIPKTSGRDDSGRTALPVPVKKKFSFWGFLKSEKTRHNTKKIHIVLKQPAVEDRPVPEVSKDGRRMISDFVALEEKIIHHYHDHHEQKMGPVGKSVPSPAVTTERPRSQNLTQTPVVLGGKVFQGFREQELLPRPVVGSSPKVPTKRASNAFETISMQSGVSSPTASKVPEPTRSAAPSRPHLGRLGMVLGWTAAGIFVFLYVQAASSHHEVTRQLHQLQGEKNALSRSYDELKDVSRQQMMEMKWLNGQLQDLSLELKKSRAEKEDIEKNFEQIYLKKLSQSAARYEKDLLALRDKIQTQNAVISALKAQSAAFEKIVGQAGMSALSGVSAGMAQEPFAGSDGFQGEVVSLSVRQKSVVISLGDTHGARFGSSVKIFRNGIEIAAGRIDRVYPTMSVVLVSDPGMLKLVQPGDKAVLS